MTIEWFDPQKRLPEDKQDCLIMPHASNSLVTVGVFGPIAFDSNLNAFVDLFRDPEAGTIVGIGDVGCWTAWEPIQPPSGLPTAYDGKSS